MARKRLSDLVREEANKPSENKTSETEVEQTASGQAKPDGKPEASQESQASKTAGRSRSKAKPNQESSQPESPSKPLSEPVSEPISEPIDVQAETVTAEDHQLLEAQTKIQELEGTIAELQAKLEAAHKTAQQTEAELKQEITELQTKLHHQQTELEQLQTDGKQVNQLKAELEDAKKMILQLSQVNAQPAPPKPTPSLVRAAEPELESSRPSRPPTHIPSSSPPKQNQIALRQILDHPTRPGKLPAMSSEKLKEPRLEEPEKIDIGWMD